MTAQSLLDLWPTEAEFIRMLYRAEMQGIRVDKELCQELTDEANQNMASLEKDLGFVPTKSSQLSDFLLHDLGLPVVSVSERTGKPSFNKKAMEEYDLMLEAINNDAAKKVLAYRGWQKASSSTYGVWPSLCDKQDRIHPEFKVHGTVTGRLSCEKPNLQQIPRKSDKIWSGRTKACFISEDEFENWEFDYSTLEFRLAAVYANEQELIERINAGEDLHQATADMILNLSGIEIPRQQAKTTNFLILYGGGVSKLALQLGCSEERAQEIYDAYHNALPGVKSVMRMATKRAKDTGYVKYWSGRRRHFRTRWTSGEEHKAFNSLCQGGGAEIVKHAMVKQQSLVSDKCRFVLQVHDSTVWEIHKSVVDIMVPKIKEIQETAVKMKVKFDVDAHRWGE